MGYGNSMSRILWKSGTFQPLFVTTAGEFHMKRIGSCSCHGTILGNHVDFLIVGISSYVMTD